MAQVNGTPGDDNLVATGDPNGDFFTAMAGNDFIAGGENNDVIRGNEGNDTINGGDGEDIINAAAGNDTIDTVDRPASFFGSAVTPKRDVVDAGVGDDSVTGGRLDQLNGNAGFDFLQVNFDFNGPFTSNPPPARPAVVLTLDANGTGTANDGTLVTGFESLNFTLTDNADTVNTGNVRASLSGGGGADVLTTGSGTIPGFSFGGEPPLIGDEIFGGGGNDVIRSGAGNDTISGGAGNDVINASSGDDLILFDPTTDGIDRVETGLGGNDTVRFEGFNTGQIRLTFVSAEVGNGDMIGSASGDGNLAVRVQREDANGALIGGVSRYDDEGVTFIEGTQGYTFDVRDLVSGAQRGDQFTGVVLGTSAGDDLSFFPPFRAAQPFYYNGGGGNDTITAGDGNDFLVGGAGNDRASGNGGNDSFIGGAGLDIISGGAGNDRIAAFNVSTDGPDQVNLGFGDDVVNITAAGPTNVRLSFISAEVGNGSSLMSGAGGFAVRIQAETGGTPAGDISQFDDEGITFVGGAGVTFDVRDFVSGAQRGEAFEVVILGDSSSQVLVAQQAARPYYINAGAGNDGVTGGDGADFLVGGAGNDSLDGGGGADRFIGGAGEDTFRFFAVSDSTPTARDTVLQFVSADDTLDLRALRTGASDTVTLSTSGGFTQVSVDQGGDGSVEFIVNVDGAVTTADYLF